MGPQAERVSTLPASRLPQRTVFHADLALWGFFFFFFCLFPLHTFPLPQFSLRPHKSLLIHETSSHLKKLSANPRERAERAEKGQRNWLWNDY